MLWLLLATALGQAVDYGAMAEDTDAMCLLIDEAVAAEFPEEYLDADFLGLGTRGFYLPGTGVVFTLTVPFSLAAHAPAGIPPSPPDPEWLLAMRKVARPPAPPSDERLAADLPTGSGSKEEAIASLPPGGGESAEGGPAPSEAAGTGGQTAPPQPDKSAKLERLQRTLIEVLVANGEYIRQLGPDERITVVAFGERRFGLEPVQRRLERALERKDPASRRLLVRGGPRTRLVISLLRADLAAYLNGEISWEELLSRTQVTRY